MSAQEKSSSKHETVESQVSRHLETVASLTTRLEQAEGEVKSAETRFHDTLAQLERETILCKDRDQTIKSLDDEVLFSSMHLTSHCIGKETEITIKKVLVFFKSSTFYSWK